MTCRECLFVCRMCLQCTFHAPQSVFCCSQTVFFSFNLVQNVSSPVHRLSFAVQKMSFLGGLPPPVAHHSPRFSVNSHTCRGVSHFVVAHDTSRFSVGFAPRRGIAFSGATFGRAAPDDPLASQRSPALDTHCANKFGMGAAWWMAEPSPKVE